MMMTKRAMVVLAAGVLAWMPSSGAGQSSSLFVTHPDELAAPVVRDVTARTDVAGPVSRLSPAIEATSYAAVRLPEPRTFAVHDLVTIVIRESTETDSRASLSTQTGVKFDGEITDFPRLSPSDLLNLQLRPNSMDAGNPKLGVRYGQDFDGDGDYRRRDSITGRITARVIDVKPNGTLVLEARKFIDSDNETLKLVLTGTARAEDIGLDNTVLSTQLYDLRLIKEHEGELRRATRKGLFTRILETIFNF